MNATSCRCFQIHVIDNVATLLDDAYEGTEVRVLGEFGDSASNTIRAAQSIRAGHKLAVHAIAPGEPLVKYGYTIGEAISPIAAGEWVHLHNCRSRYDAVSSDLDLQSGVRKDARYD